jgi:arsenite methyltransferase
MDSHVHAAIGDNKGGEVRSLSSAGHARSSVAHLARHFRYALPEYEDALRYAGFQPNDRVLDAGCGGGDFLPWLMGVVGSGGAIGGLDVAQENIQQAQEKVRENIIAPRLEFHVGSVTAIPWATSSFEGVWSANVMQYLNSDDARAALSEFKRVLVAGGRLAIKESDSSLLQVLPKHPELCPSLHRARRRRGYQLGRLGPWSGPELAPLLQQLGFVDVEVRTWLVERHAPFAAEDLDHLSAQIQYLADIAREHGADSAEQRVWDRMAATPDEALRDPGCFVREGFVVARCRRP